MLGSCKAMLKPICQRGVRNFFTRSLFWQKGTFCHCIHSKEHRGFLVWCNVTGSIGGCETLRRLTTATKNYDELEIKLGRSFKNRELLAEALRHASRKTKKKGPEQCRTQGRLEYLGDSVLSLIVARHLFDNFPDMKEGQMTMIRQAAVNERNLAKISRELDLGSWIELHPYTDFSGARDLDSVLADTFEAILAAIFIEHGLDAASEFVLKVRCSCCKNSRLFNFIE